MANSAGASAMCSAKRSYQAALALAPVTSFSTIGRRAASNAGSAAATSSPCAASARSSAMASSMASRVPEPMEKCAVCSASPISTYLPWCQRLFQTSGNRRQIELLEISGWPPSASAKIFWHRLRDSESSIRAKPARAKVASSVSTMNVLRPGA